MPNNLKTYKLTELVENIVDNRGKTCPTAEVGIPLIATNCIRNEKLFPDFINVRYVSDETYNNWFRAHPIPDDMLFVLKGTPGRVCWTPNPINFCIAQDMVALRAKKEIIYPKYLFALLRSKIAQDKINALHVGSLIPHFKKTDFDKLELPVFEDINYQKEIGDIYFDICNKIENNLAINKTLEEMAMALYKHWFVDFGPFQDGEFVESELGLIPKGWKVRRLVEVCEKIYSGGTPKTSNEKYWNGDIPWLSSGETRDKFIISADKKITQLGLNKSSARMARCNDTVIASAGQGKTRGQTSFLFLDTSVNQSVIILSANKSLINSETLF
ncbi:MAG: restriction endonuclease subunit S, partial [Candidatus Paceibacterota bacterium]